MATVYGNKSEGRAFTLKVPIANVASTSADTSYKMTIPANWEGYIDIGNCFAVVTTAIVNTTTAATVVIKKGTTAIGSATCVDTSATGIIFSFTPAAGYTAGVALAAADYLTVGWTQGSGGTIAGVLDAYVALELANLGT